MLCGTGKATGSGSQTGLGLSLECHLLIWSHCPHFYHGYKKNFLLEMLEISELAYVKHWCVLSFLNRLISFHVLVASFGLIARYARNAEQTQYSFNTTLKAIL